MEKKTWLVYLLTTCEMGSEGWSGWMYHCVAFGDTDEEIYNNWIENVKKIHGKDLSKHLRCNNGYWSCMWCKLCKNELPTQVYGHSEELNVEKCYRGHIV